VFRQVLIPPSLSYQYLAGKNHNPSVARRISREIKRGESPESLLPLAKGINDPYYRSLSLVSIASSISSKKSKKIFESAFREVDNVKEEWRRIELLGKITKSLKIISDGNQKNRMFEKVLILSSKGKEEATKDFVVKYSKNYPDELLETLLYHTINLKQYSFESSKAVIRIWVKRKPVDSLLAQLSVIPSNLRTRLLGYLHFQLSKSKIQIKPTALETALQADNSEEILRYLVRICSSPSDLGLVASTVSDQSPAIILALTARADRKGWAKEARAYASQAQEMIDHLSTSN